MPVSPVHGGSITRHPALRPSFMRVLKEAKPYLDMFPNDDAA
jgi:hypothetical protein